jgi:hypothetical protein
MARARAHDLAGGQDIHFQVGAKLEQALGQLSPCGMIPLADREQDPGRVRAPLCARVSPS